MTAITYKDTPIGNQLARQALTTLHNAGLGGDVVASSQYTTMRPGFLVVNSGVYQSQQDAEAHLAAVRDAGYADAYSRQIVPVYENATGTVRKFYQLVNDQRADVAWALLSQTFRSAWQYGNWLAGYRNTRSVQVESLSVVSSDADTAQVAVAILAVDANGNQDVTRRFRGVWNLVRLERSWQLDVGRIKEVL